MRPSVVWAVTSNVTGLVTPRSVSSPTAVALICSSPTGMRPKSIGSVMRNSAVGNSAAFMMRPLNWPSRRPSSLVMFSICTVMSTTVAVVPSIVSRPSISLLRPTAVVFTPASTSSTR